MFDYYTHEGHQEQVSLLTEHNVESKKASEEIINSTVPLGGYCFAHISLKYAI